MTDGKTAPAPAAVPDDPLVGTVIGERYRICARLSQGGMGVVYRAEHVLLKSEFAVKVLRRPQDSTSQKRFVKEAQIASRIKHPNIVFISDFGVTPEQHSYLVMELLGGHTLKSELKAGRLSALRACRIAAQIARGMHAAHAHGIVHRDLKPDNILLVTAKAQREQPAAEADGSEDVVKIIDFGIAKDTQVLSAEATALLRRDGATVSSATSSGASAGTSSGQGAALTQAGVIVGTPAYMAPEQALNRPIDPRADQYALGCMLYHMLCGSPPFSAETPFVVLAMHMQDSVEPLHQRCPEAAIPPSLEAIVLRLLAKDPPSRFASMQELEQQLAQEIAQLDPAQKKRAPEVFFEPPTRLAPLPPATGLRRLSRRAVLALIGGVALLSILIGLLSWRALRRPAPPPPLPIADVRGLSERATRILIEHSQHGELAVRIAAVSALGTARSDQARDVLLALLDATEPQLREKALDSLGRMGDRDVIPFLQSALTQDAEERVRLAAAQALLQLEAPEGELALQQQLSSGAEELRLRAALLLCERRLPAALEYLNQLREKARLRPAALWPVLFCQARTGSAPARQQLVDALHGTTAQPEQLEVALYLYRLGDAEGRKLLQRLFEQPGPLQLVAARELAAIGESIESDIFRYVIADEQADAAARITATYGLSWSGAPHDVRLLQPLLANKTNPNLQLAAAAGVLQLIAKDPRIMAVQSATWARRAIHDADWQVRQAGIAVLGDSQWSDATALLTNMLRDDHEQVRASSVRSLGRRGERRAQEALLDSLSDATPAVQQEALSALLQKTSELRAKNGLAQLAIKRVNAVLPTMAIELEVKARVLLSRLGDGSQTARLAQLATSQSVAVRRVLVESKIGDADFSVRFLSDPVWKVRLGAACQLAARGDRRAMAVLSEAMRKGGPDAILAYAALLRLGEKLAEPPELLGLITVSLVEQRMAAVEASAALPPARAVSFLEAATRDPEPLVRRLVAEIAGELAMAPQGAVLMRVLQRLSFDSDAAVRARAEVLLARIMQPAEPVILAPAQPLKARPRSTAEAAAPIAVGPRPGRGAGSGGLQIQAPAGVWFQIDARPWMTTPVSTQSLPAGAHRLGSFSGEQTFLVETGKVQTLRLPESEIERHVNVGAAALRQKDFRAAQKNLEKAHALCQNSRDRARPCAALQGEIAYHLAASYEGLERWPEAMNWYEKLGQSAGKLSAERRSSAQQAMARLAPRLGKIIVKRNQGGKCLESTIWMPPGEHVLQVNGRAEAVTVRPRSITRVGACS